MELSIYAGYVDGLYLMLVTVNTKQHSEPADAGATQAFASVRLSLLASYAFSNPSIDILFHSMPIEQLPDPVECSRRTRVTP
jgi:hypothetical protein